MEIDREKIIYKNIEDEIKLSYINYAMSVIVGRALPDVRDGLKPVHRRILYTMNELRLRHNQPYKKSARVVGDCLGKYHPHGDTAVYDAMVRMVQEFSLRYPLIEGQGNFGSVDGDSAAAMRYTEVRLDSISDEMLADIEKNTVDFVPNFDGSLTEPSILPAKIPNLLINGSSGIAVGMATNIPPHNLTEVINGLFELIDNPDIEIRDLIKIIKAPDFPTGAIIYGREGVKNAYATGRGSIQIRAKVEIVDRIANRQNIIINELPYQVNKANLLETIAGMVRDKKLTGISDLRDESDRKGMRVVIELKRDENAEIILNQLYKHTQMQVSFGVIMLALVNNRPRLLNLKQMLEYYLDYRKVIVTRRCQFDLDKAERRAHILEGLKIAIDNLNNVIKTIRKSKDSEIALQALMNEFTLSKVQAQAILDMRLHQLTNLEVNKLQQEYLELIKLIEMLKAILASPQKILNIIKEEFLQIREKYGDARRTKIISKTIELEIEDLIQEEDVVVTISHAGYVKRLPGTTYRSQHRGGRGITGMITRDEDFVEDVFITSTHNYMLFFTDRGRVYWKKVYEIPEASRSARGKALVNLIRLTSSDERVNAVLTIHDFTKDSYVLMATSRGVVKKTPLEAYSNPRNSGIIAIDLDKNDSLIGVKMTDGKQEVVIGTRKGLAIHFNEKEVRPIGRTGKGVRGIMLNKDDEVIGMEVVRGKETFLTVTENGYGKRTRADRYRLQSRGGKGVINIKANQRNGNVVGIKRVTDNDDIVLMTTKGIVNRQPIDTISVLGRNTQGVRLIRLQDNDKLVSMARIVKDVEEDTEAK